MTKEERTLLLAAVTLALGRAPPGVLSDEDKAFLAQFVGQQNDWPAIAAGLMPIIRAVAEG